MQCIPTEGSVTDTFLISPVVLIIVMIVAPLGEAERQLNADACIRDGSSAGASD